MYKVLFLPKPLQSGTLEWVCQRIKFVWGYSIPLAALRANICEPSSPKRGQSGKHSCKKFFLDKIKWITGLSHPIVICSSHPSLSNGTRFRTTITQWSQHCQSDGRKCEVSRTPTSRYNLIDGHLSITRMNWPYEMHPCRLHCPVKDLVRRLSAELVSPLRYAALSDTDYVMLRALVALNPGLLLLLSTA